MAKNAFNRFEMKLTQTHSSIVMIGDSFAIGVFDVGKHKEILGELDNTRSIIMPVLANYSFKDSAFHLLVEPQKFQIDYRNDSILPDELLTIGMEAANAFSSTSPQGIIRAIGINLNVIVPQEELGISGIDFCASHFISNQSTWNEILSPEDDLSPAGRIVYRKDGIKYTIRFEPHYKSDMSNLFIDFNAHQEIEPQFTIEQLPERYQSVREYFLEVLSKSLVAR